MPTVFSSHECHLFANVHTIVLNTYEMQQYKTNKQWLRKHKKHGNKI